VQWLGLFIGFFNFVFSFFMVLYFLVIPLLCCLVWVTGHVFDDFLWCCVKRGNLVSYLVFLFIFVECCTVSVVITWAARAARLGVGAISQG
jgi:hypothetical protein